MKLSLASPADTQRQLADALRLRRKSLKLSRRLLAQRSAVPEPTIKRFERTGEISLRQFLILWSCVDDLKGFAEIAHPPKRVPQSIDEVLSS